MVGKIYKNIDIEVLQRAIKGRKEKVKKIIAYLDRLETLLAKIMVVDMDKEEMKGGLFEDE